MAQKLSMTISAPVAHRRMEGMTMAMRLEKENVRIILMDILNSTEYYGLEDKQAEHTASYTAGVLDMAIEDLGGK